MHVDTIFHWTNHCNLASLSCVVSGHWSGTQLGTHTGLDDATRSGKSWLDERTSGSLSFLKVWVSKLMFDSSSCRTGSSLLARWLSIPESGPCTLATVSPCACHPSIQRNNPAGEMCNEYCRFCCRRRIGYSDLDTFFGKFRKLISTDCPSVCYAISNRRHNMSRAPDREKEGSSPPTNPKGPN
jgi:hypothetical protein